MGYDFLRLSYSFDRGFLQAFSIFYNRPIFFPFMTFLGIQNAEVYLVSASILGFLGSFHCVGMCGAITLALPPVKSSVSRFMVGKLFYNLGRASSYALLGIILGGVSVLFPTHRYQESLSIAVGIGMIVFAFLPSLPFAQVYLRRKTQIFTGLKSFWARGLFALRRVMGMFLASPSLGRQYVLGVLNGLLPCGFVYVALASAALLPRPLEAGFFMFCFGLGTLPAMLFLALSLRGVSLTARDRFRRFIPIGVFVLGLFFIVRGLSLGIPYLSPKLSGKTVTEVCTP